MTRTEIVQELKYMIGPGVAVDGAGLAMFVNDAYLYMVDCLTAANPDYFTKAATAPTLNNQQQYDLPDDFKKALMVNVRQNGVWARCLPLPNITDVPIVSRTDSNQGYDVSNPYFYIVGDQIGFMPIPTDSAGVLKLWYVFDPVELTSDNSKPAIPTTYHHSIKYGAYANYLDQDDQHGAADSMRNRFQQRIEKMIETMYENQAEESKTIKILNDPDIYYNGF